MIRNDLHTNLPFFSLHINCVFTLSQKMQSTFIPRNYGNTLVKSVSFYLERFQRYGVYNFLGHPVYCFI